MALPNSPNSISLSQVNTELNRPATQNINMNDSAVRTLAGVPTPLSTISMSNLYGKSNRITVNLVISDNSQNRNIGPGSGPLPYIAGKTDLIITVNPGIYVYSVLQGVPALRIRDFASTDTVTIVNRGFIMGLGGNGAAGNFSGNSNGSAGGDAILIGTTVPVTINNTYDDGFLRAYIGGGGGGGAAGFGTTGGGGGAGGGLGGSSNSGQAAGGFDGGLGGYGQSGQSISSQGAFYTGGGGGGRAFPGEGGSGLQPGGGGSAGGAGGYFSYPVTNEFTYGGNGGSGNQPGQTSTTGNTDPPAGAGGGGWGAAGGSVPGIGTGGSGGYAVRASGGSVTFVGGDTSRVYGAVG